LVAAVVCGPIAVAVLLIHKPQSPSRVKPHIKLVRSGLWQSLQRPSTRKRSWKADTLQLVIVGLYFAVLSLSQEVKSMRLVSLILLVPVVIIALLAAVAAPAVIIHMITAVPIDVEVAVDPSSVLKTDRSASIIRAATSALITGLLVALIPKFDIGIGIFVGIVVGLIAAEATAWGGFQVVRGWYRARSELPYSLLAFLEDAHRRGVLRHAGAAYQFRHARLQEYLAGLPPNEQRK
jgi:hypothetical protein